MKKTCATVVLSTLMLTLLCACAGYGIPPATSVPASGSAGDTSQSAPASQPAPAPFWSPTFKQAEFQQFFETSWFALFISTTVKDLESLQEKPRTQNMCSLMTNYLQHFALRSNTLIAYDPSASIMVYPLEQLERLSQEMFGFQYDFTYALTLSTTKVPGYLSHFYFLHENVFIVPDSVAYSNNVASIRVDYWGSNNSSSFEDAQDRREFRFAFQPDNTLCPYRLISVTSVGALTEAATPDNTPAPTEPGTVLPDTVYLRPPYSTSLAEGGLNLRTGPGTDYDSIELIPYFSPFIDVYGTLSTVPGWAYVSCNGKTGWVSTEYLGSVYYNAV